MSVRSKHRRPKSTAQTDLGQSNNVADPRFANFQTDPRYRLPSKKRAKVQLDSRFSRMLNDEDFHRRAKVDRYGRRINGDKGKKDLQRLYRVEDEISSGNEADDPIDESGEDDEIVEKELRKASKVQKALKQGYDPARDGGFSSSSDSDTSDEGEEEEEQVEGNVEEAEVFGPQDQGTVPMGEVTRRIAVVNLDWDNVRAADLLAVASSFTPPEGRIESVTVYPSEFGRERMQREELEGPPSEIFYKSAKVAQEETIGNGQMKSGDSQTTTPHSNRQQHGPAEDFDSTALRRYQLDRLRYYYAVIACSSIDVSQALYENMDGREYLSSANFFDLRFIPDDVSFETDKPRDTCDRVPEGYRPNEFVTDALQHSKVRLTWDEDDRDRKDVQKRAFGRGGMDVEENDMLAYVASASSDEGSDDNEEDGGVPIMGRERFGLGGPDLDTEDNKTTHNKMSRAATLRAALGLSGDQLPKTKYSTSEEKPVGNLQITFSTGLSDKRGGPVIENEPEETTKEKYVRKEKERKARRKAKGKTSVTDDNSAEVGADERGDIAAPPTIEAGFDDPFFEHPEEANRDALKKARKEEKARLRRERIADQDANARQRAELELIMAEEQDSRGSRPLRHFDMNDIAKEEKQQRRKRKGKKGSSGLEEPAGTESHLGTEAAFTMDVSDARFAKVFENHEYAIDPNDPRFKGTDGMRALLEEGRRRRGKRKDIDEAADVSKHSQKRAKVGTSNGAEGMDRLLQKVKNRTNKV